jgi:hypothetical protein
MKSDVTGQTETDILTLDVSDDALERARRLPMASA